MRTDFFQPSILDMGSWKLEVIRMACYISFPLAAMFLFSRPEFFKDRVIADRKRYHPPPNPERDEIVRQMKERERLRRESDVLEQMNHYQNDEKDLLLRECMDPATTAVVNYLEQRAEVDRVHVKDKSRCSADALTAWEEKYDCELPEDLRKFYTTSDGLEIRWSCKTGTSNALPMFIGKIYINSLMDLAKIPSQGAKTANVEELNDFAENDSPRFNTHAWHIFELDPCDGQGRVCLVYNTHHEVSIWFLDRSLKFHRLASTFTDYYRLLLLHCGLPYWYYKYTDIGIPPYILHWYYIIAPSLLISHSQDDFSSSNLIPFNAEKVFQRNAGSASKNSKASNQQNSTGQIQPPYPIAGIRSATQNQKRPTQQTKSVNRSSSVPRSMNN